MKVGILTLALKANYGGNLQAYALMKVIKNLGHDTFLISVDHKELVLWRNPIRMIKRFIKKLHEKYILKEKVTVLNNKKELGVIRQHTNRFVIDCINPKTRKCVSTSDLIQIGRECAFDAIVVGSDQVWRPDYTPQKIENYFLSFITGKNTRKISYAASFGTSEWTFSESQTSNCSKLLKEFDSVSVREASGVKLCKKYFGVSAEHVLDPTMLLNKEDYKEVTGARSSDKNNSLLVYILDEDNDKQKVINRVSTFYGYTAFKVNNNKSSDISVSIEERILPSVEQWLLGFMNASYVIADSFHACAFSILFNKPFLIYANKSRGLTRFSSILELFKLEDRLITSSSVLSEEKLSDNINWDHVNKVLESEREKSLDFLRSSFSDLVSKKS